MNPERSGAMQNERQILYHYTDYKALNGILNEGVMRVNNVLNMNDAAEMRLFMNGICEAASHKLKESGYLRESFEMEELFREELLREFQYSAYAACFSTLKDDAAQWERYGNKGRGVCIGFYFDAMKQIADSIEPLALEKMYYRDDMADHPLSDVFFQIGIKREKLSSDDPLIRDNLNRAWASSAFFKHPSFKNENEVRLMVSPVYGFMDMTPAYHISEDRVKKYYPLNLKKYREDLGITLNDFVGIIIIGPDSSQSKPILSDYFEDNGMEELCGMIKYSECPLRRSSGLW